MPFAIAAAAIPAVTSVAGLAMNASGAGGTSSSTNQSSNGTQTNTPWAPQGSSFQTGLTANDNLYQQLSSMPAYSGSLYAQQNGMQHDAQSNATNYATGQGSQAINQTADVGNSLTPWAEAYGNEANSVMTNGLGYQQNSDLTGALSNIGSGAQGAVNSGLSSTLNTAAMNGANSINSYNTGLSNIAQQSMSDPTQRLAADAGTYANSAAVQGQISNVNAQIDNTLNQQTVPGLNRQAAQGGALNSSRAGAAEAQAQSGAALAKSNADSALYANAYNTGLGTASSQYSSGLNSSLAANTAGLSGNSNLALGTANNQIGATNTQISAANSGLSNALNYNQANVNTQLAGNQQLLSGVNTGLTANLQGQTLAQGNYALAGGVANYDQTDSQNALNAAYQSYLMPGQNQQTYLSNYMNTAAIPKGYGTQTSNSTGTGASTPAANYANSIGAIGSGVGGLYSNYMNSGSSNPFSGAGTGYTTADPFG